MRNHKLSLEVDVGAAGIPVLPDLDPFTDPISLAVIDLISELGYENVTEDAVIDRASVRAEDFYRRFADKQDCTIATIAACRAELRWKLECAYASADDWQGGLRAAAWAAADFLDAHSALVQVVVVDLLQARNEMLRVVREDTLMFPALFIDRGRAAAPDPAAVPKAAAMMVMGSIAQLLSHRLQKGLALEPHEMVRPMLYMAVCPYLGEEAARKELRASRPPGSHVERPTAER
jgi:AcrR family transcriptional regulator